MKSGSRPHPRVLLAEGSDDMNVAIHILKAHGIENETVWVIDIKGNTNLRKVLSVELKSSVLESIGILLDAEIDVNARWQSISDTLSLHGYTLPHQAPQIGGAVLAPVKGIAVGAWVMPDNTSAGMLEHFINKLVRSDDDLWQDSVEAVARVIDSGKHRFPLDHRIKAELNTWLAWQKEPGINYGIAIKENYLDPKCGPGIEFFDWMKRLFTL